MIQSLCLIMSSDFAFMYILFSKTFYLYWQSAIQVSHVVCPATAIINIGIYGIFLMAQECFSSAGFCEIPMGFFNFEQLFLV